MGDTTGRPYTLLSCGISLDGYLDDASGRRLLLSNDADFDRVDGVRAGCDAIMVGATTVRRDDPRLLVRSAERIARRTAAGLSPSPTKVTVTSSGCLDPRSRFFSAGGGQKLLYCPRDTFGRVRSRFADLATVVDAGPTVEMAWLVEDLHRRGVRRLMVEGGGTVHTQFLTAGLADELHLVVAPFFVGDSRARRFVDDGPFPWCPGRRATLLDTQRIGDVVLLRYALTQRGLRGCAGDERGPVDGGAGDGEVSGPRG